jgi:hypothetical protein
LSRTGQLFAVTTMLAAVALPMLSRNWGYTVVSPFSPNDGPAGEFLTTLAFALSPLLFVAIQSIKRCLKPNPRGDERDAWFSFIASKGETVELRGPTSLEFAEHLDDVLREPLASANRRLVVVLDNLDRLSTADAERAWATLQSLLHEGSNTERSWFARVWLLVPYDPAKIRSRSGDAGSIGAKGEHREGLLDKIFSVRFRVTAPLLIDRRRLLRLFLQKALPAHGTSEEVDNICRVFDYFMDKRSANGSPTIRELKTFVNELGSLHRQYQHRVPIAHQACFVLLRQHLKDSAPQPMDIARKVAQDYDSLPVPTFLKEGQPNPIFDSLLFLSFGLPNREAIVMFFARELIRSGDARTLRTILLTNDVSEEVATAQVEVVVQEIENAAFAVAAAAILPNIGRFTQTGQSSILLQLVHRALGHGNLDLNKSFLEGTSQLCRAAPRHAGQVLKKLFKSTKSLTTTNPEEWVPSLIELTRIAQNFGVEDASFSLPGESVPALRAICRAIVATNPDGSQWMWFHVPRQLFAGLSRSLFSDKIDDGFVAILLMGCREGLAPPLENLVPSDKDPVWRTGDPNSIFWFECLWALSEAGVNDALTRLDTLFDGPQGEPLRGSGNRPEQAIRFLVRPNTFGISRKQFPELFRLVELYAHNLDSIVQGMHRNRPDLPSAFLQFAIDEKSRHVENLEQLVRRLPGASANTQ